MAARAVRKRKMVQIESGTTSLLVCFAEMQPILYKDSATISKWCTNASQPDLVTLTKVADLLDVDVRQLINKTKGNIADD